MTAHMDYVIDGKRYEATQEALNYMRDYDLADGVQEIVGKMRELMPEVKDVRIELLIDPTCDCDPELCLRAIFPASLDEDTADAALDRFDAAWWLDACDRWDYRIEVHSGWDGEKGSTEY